MKHSMNNLIHKSLIQYSRRTYHALKAISNLSSFIGCVMKNHHYGAYGLRQNYRSHSHCFSTASCSVVPRQRM
ncbi:hypothetical protein Tcan_14894 [Toxocara canis]|uniref:Uncharacterized protein n=1 Tax=Toxocara canis TaxID=6265 RepID=A0A0B2V7R7_TOXCA|nr:hypothetical protein Tcan_14894 [Toxocara canis]